mmetsp:Transcript_23682/g.30807  ORF Transcript_23682/g.30807 Transcript_23682/m.30807 type:complete len:1341 (+) Transcript_23682:154-4176(+)
MEEPWEEEERRQQAYERSKERSRRIAREYLESRQGKGRPGGSFAFGKYTPPSAETSSKKSRSSEKLEASSRRRRRLPCNNTNKQSLGTGSVADSIITHKERLSLGCRIDVLDKKGQPRRLDCGKLLFLGPTKFSTGRQVWCGIELDFDLGAHDGTVDGVRYFTAGKSRGLFVPAELCQVSQRYKSEKGIVEEDSTPPNKKITHNDKINITQPIVTPQPKIGNDRYEAMRNNPDLAKYFKMVELGVPKSAVACKMISDGIDKNDVHLFDRQGKVFATVPLEDNPQKVTGPRQHDKRFRALHWEEQTTPHRPASAIPPVDVHSHEWTMVVAAFGKKTILQHEIASTQQHQFRNQPNKTLEQQQLPKPPILDSRRGMNVAIMLAKVCNDTHYPDAQAVARALLERPSQHRLSVEQLESLAAMCPTPDECAKLIAVNNSTSLNSQAEQFLWQLARVPHCRQRIDAELCLASSFSRLAAVHTDARLRLSVCLRVANDFDLGRCLATLDAVATAMRYGPHTLGSAWNPKPTKSVALHSLLAVCRSRAPNDESLTLLDAVIFLMARRGEAEAPRTLAKKYGASSARLEVPTVFITKNNQAPSFKFGGTEATETVRSRGFVVGGLTAASSRGEPRELTVIVHAVKASMQRARSFADQLLAELNDIDREEAREAAQAALDAEANDRDKARAAAKAALDDQIRQAETSRRKEIERAENERKLMTQEEAKFQLHRRSSAAKIACDAAFLAIDRFRLEYEQRFSTHPSSNKHPGTPPEYSDASTVEVSSPPLSPSSSRGDQLLSGSKAVSQQKKLKKNLSVQQTPPTSKINPKTDPMAWAKKKKEALERASAMRAIRMGLTLPANEEVAKTPKSKQQAWQQQATWRERIAAEHETKKQRLAKIEQKKAAARQRPPRLPMRVWNYERKFEQQSFFHETGVLRIARSWSQFVVTDSRFDEEMLEFVRAIGTTTDQALKALRLRDDLISTPTLWKQIILPPEKKIHSLSRTTVANDNNANDKNRINQDKTARSATLDMIRAIKPSPKTKPAFLAAIATAKLVSGKTNADQKKKKSKAETLAIRKYAQSLKSDLCRVEIAIDAAEAEVAATAAAGAEMAMKLGSPGTSSDSILNWLGEFSRLVAKAVRNSDYELFDDPFSIADAVMTPYGAGRVAAKRRQHGRLCIDVQLSWGLAHLDRKHVAKPPHCRVRTPQGDGKVISIEKDRWLVSLLSGGTTPIEFLASQLKWLPHHHHHHHHGPSTPGSSITTPKHRSGSAPPPRSPSNSFHDSLGQGRSSPRQATICLRLPAQGGSSSAIPENMPIPPQNNDDDSASSSSSSDDSDLDDLRNLGSFLEV